MPFAIVTRSARRKFLENAHEHKIPNDYPPRFQESREHDTPHKREMALGVSVLLQGSHFGGVDDIVVICRASVRLGLVLLTLAHESKVVRGWVAGCGREERLNLVLESGRRELWSLNHRHATDVHGFWRSAGNLSLSAAIRLHSHGKQKLTTAKPRRYAGSTVADSVQRGIGSARDSKRKTVQQTAINTTGRTKPNNHPIVTSPSASTGFSNASSFAFSSSLLFAAYWFGCVTLSPSPTPSPFFTPIAAWVISNTRVHATW